jgi:uncharacterized protein YqeY
MTIQQRIDEANHEALRQQDKPRRSILSFLLAALKKTAVDTRQEGLSDLEAIAVIQKLKKQLQETLESAQKGNRTALVEGTTYEISVVEEFLPAAPPETEIRSVVAEEIAKIGATSIRDMGKVMSAASQRLAGVDKAQLSKIIKEALS